MVQQDTIDRLKAIVGPAGWIEDGADLPAYLTEWRGRYQGETPLLLRPANTDEIAAIVSACAETRTPIVPQGGNTGLVGGQIPKDGEVLLSLNRMTAIRRVDAENATMTVEAGCPLASAKGAALDEGLLFATSLASEGTATIGGIISTNAGGTNVLKYGMTRDLVLGLEVVLPSGEVWSGLSGLRKDNTGYDLKQLFIGAEGTLGIVTAATLKLHPPPNATATAFAGQSRLDDAVDLLRLAQTMSGGGVSTFEIIPATGMRFVLRHTEGSMNPLGDVHPWQVLVEVDGNDQTETTGGLQDILIAASDRGLVRDASIAQSEAQAIGFRQLRERLSEVQKLEGGSIKHDVSVAISDVASFVDEAIAAVQRACPGVRPVAFGHLGDGNIHFNLSQPESMSKDEFLARWEDMARIVHDIVANYGGSISAEHGIGQMKRDEILRYKSKTEIGLMKGVKQLLDPHNIMNPGKVVLI